MHLRHLKYEMTYEGLYKSCPSIEKIVEVSYKSLLYNFDYTNNHHYSYRNTKNRYGNSTNSFKNFKHHSDRFTLHPRIIKVNPMERIIRQNVDITKPLLCHTIPVVTIEENHKRMIKICPNIALALF